MKKSAITFTGVCLVLAGIAAYALGAQKLTPKQARDLALDRITLLEISMADFNLSEPARERMSKHISKLRTAIQEIALDGEVPKSFEQLAEEAAKKTDAEFCGRALRESHNNLFKYYCPPPEPAVEWLPNHVGLACRDTPPVIEKDENGRYVVHRSSTPFICQVEVGIRSDGVLMGRKRPREAKP